MLKRNKEKLLKQLKEGGFSLEDSKDVESYIEIFGENSLSNTDHYYHKSPWLLADEIIKESGFVYFRQDEDASRSPMVAYRISDISTFSHYIRLGKEYIEFTMSNGIRVEKYGNTGMAQALTYKFMYNNVWSEYCTTPQEKDIDKYQKVLYDNYKPKKNK